MPCSFAVVSYIKFSTVLQLKAQKSKHSKYSSGTQLTTCPELFTNVNASFSQVKCWQTDTDDHITQTQHSVIINMQNKPTYGIANYLHSIYFKQNYVEQCRRTCLSAFSNRMRATWRCFRLHEWLTQQRFVSHLLGWWRLDNYLGSLRCLHNSMTLSQ